MSQAAGAPVLHALLPDRQGGLSGPHLHASKDLSLIFLLFQLTKSGAQFCPDTNFEYLFLFYIFVPVCHNKDVYLLLCLFYCLLYVNNTALHFNRPMNLERHYL